MNIIEDILRRASEYEDKLPPAQLPSSLPRGAEIAAFIDHTLLKPEATLTQIEKLCREAREHHFAAVCINPSYVPLACGLLNGSAVRVCTVIGFPLGATLPVYKVLEALACLNAGAVEIDMVIQIGALKSQAYGQVLNEIEGVVQVAHNQRAIVKVILEMALLTHQEKIIACLLSQAAGADFVKTSTGFGPGGATVEDIDLMVRLVGPKVKVKAAGGIRTLADAQAMLQAGASRLGASAGVKILEEAIL
jgi:deoxyribose-phosphate aldolase